MSNRTLGIVGSALALALVAVGVTWFIMTHERVEEEVEVGYSGMARVNPYYATELFLEEMGIPTESRFGLNTMPTQDKTLVILTRDIEARHALTDKVRQWVTTGGRLVVVATPPARSNLEAPTERELDPLITMAGLSLLQTSFPSPGPLFPELNRSADEENAGLPDGGVGSSPDAGGGLSPSPDAAARPEAQPEDLPDILRGLFHHHARRELVEVYVPGGTRPLTASMNVAWTLIQGAPDEQAGLDGDQLHRPLRPFVPLVQVPMGRGLVTAVVDDYFLTNRMIGERDHARLLYEIMSSHGTPSGAVLVVRARAQGVWGLLWQRAWMVLISLIMLTVLWVWMASRRFGPILPDLTHDRRSLLEHLDASGAFLWRRGYHDLLLEAARVAVRQRMAARLGGDVNLEGRDFAQAVSQETGLPSDQVFDAFYGGSPRDRRAFVRVMRELQHLWRTR